jgi:predicted esterase
MRPFLAILLFAPLAWAAPPEQKTSAKGLKYHVRLADKDAKGPRPLFIALHGAGGSGDNMMRWITGPQSTVPKDAVLIAPTAAKNGEWDAPDLEPLVDLVKSVKAEFAPSRTYLTGFSRGGYWTFHLGTLHPELIDGAIPCSGGLPGAVPDTEAVRRLPFYVLHGDADDVVPISESERSVKALEAAKVPVKFERIAGMKHDVDWAGWKRGLDWVNGILDERQKALDDEVGKQIAELEKALKEKSWEAAAAGFGAIARVPARLAPKLAALAKTHVTSPEEAVSLAAISAAGRCGADGVAALKGILGTNEKLAPAVAAALGKTGAPGAAEPLLAYLKTKSDTVATAAAEALGELGGDAATAALVAGLANCEALLPASPRKAAIVDALKKVTGQSFAKSSEWKKWIAESGKK